MTDLEKFKQLFDTCSIWRGGGSLTAGPEDGHVAYQFNIALDDPKTKYHKEYVELIAYFNFDGEWVKTVPMKRTRRR